VSCGRLVHQRRTTNARARAAQSERLETTRRDIEAKIAVEEEARAARLVEVRAMERQELELIERLRRVQTLQQEAYSALEAALASRPLGSSRRGSALSGSDTERRPWSGHA
jgi:hypothetical protein